MTDCQYCHRPVHDEQDTDSIGNHKFCYLESEERINNNMCVKCNNKSQNIECDDCMANGSNYTGYKGPVP